MTERVSYNEVVQDLAFRVMARWKRPENGALPQISEHEDVHFGNGTARVTLKIEMLNDDG